ncbi:MAG: ATPase [Bacteroidales bacterium]|nr:ATPase [Bacteroidales bacterium]
MKTPFIFGRIAKDENFTDREKETKHLVSNFRSLINTVIISPRRWGKSSLVAKAAEEAGSGDNHIRICFVDMFSIRAEEQFYSNLANTVLKATSSKWEESVDSAKRFFRHLVPKIVLNADLTNEFSLNFDWKELKANPDEVLDLAEKIASEKKQKLIVCIDEFQNISEFDDPLFFQKRLRSHWQRHQHVAYCLYGSKRHMMLDVFSNPSMPFFKFGDLIFLEKIDTPSLTGFIRERFSSTKKSISDDLSRLIVALADNHPYYVQQLSQQVWLRTKSSCSETTVREAHLSLIEQFSLLFVTITETLTTNQINYLRALVAGEKALSSSAVLIRYNLISSAAVNRSRNSLIEKDILDNMAGKISFQDPMYRYWLEHTYFASVNSPHTAGLS